MANRIHFVITGEVGESRHFVLSRKLLKITAMSVVVVLFVLVVMSMGAVNLFWANMDMQERVEQLATDLRKTRVVNQGLENQVADLESEKQALLDNAVGELTQRSRLIESVLNTVGIDVNIEESGENSGGIFTPLAERETEDLLDMAERYLERFQTVPLGAPAPGVVTSRFGRRIDPINGKLGFHDGVDIRGKVGADVLATADGKVFEAGQTKGLGRYVIIDHGNDFRTLYAHMKKLLVARNDVVERGQVIGYVGNTGRSTGPHVHYEVHHQGKLANPLKFMRVATYAERQSERRLTHKVTITPIDITPGQYKNTIKNG